MPDALRDYLIAELAAPGVPVVPFAPGIDQAALLDGDDNPLFVTLPIAKVGKSRNGRYYDAAVVAEIAAQVNRDRPGGILGHISEGERATRYDRPEVLWLGATVVGDVAYGKGYIPPYARDTRDFLRRAKASGHAISTSIYGQWQQVRDAGLDALRVLVGGTLESIDFAPASRAGMAFGGGFALSAEMDHSTGGTQMDRGEIIRTMTVAELAQLPQAVREHIDSERRAAVAEQLAPVSAALGLAEDAPVAKVVTTVTEMATARREADEAAARQAVDTHLDTQLAERVAKDAPDDSATKARATVRRLVVAEMRERTIAEADRALVATLGDETVAEMVAVLVKAAPVDGKPTMVGRNAAPLTARHGAGESKFVRTTRDY